MHARIAKVDDMTIRTALLADHANAIKAIARLMEEEWSDWYRPGYASAAQDLQARMQRDRLPLGLVALADEQAVGTCALTATSGGLETERTPWLGGLLVAPAHRRRGVGKALLQRSQEEAGRLGFDRIYALTAAAHALFLHEGWELVETIILDDEPHGIYAIATA
ncbi:hypothetical protein C4375_03360 [Devosia sp. I507]|nr:hypothetical protein C4375_03360 [Devosia sp. I507]